MATDDFTTAVDFCIHLGLFPVFGFETCAKYDARGRDVRGGVKVSRRELYSFYGAERVGSGTFCFPMEPTYWVTDMTLARLEKDPKLVNALF